MKCFDNGARGEGGLGVAPGVAPAKPPIVDRTAWLIVAAAVPVHLGLALATDLSPDEAYYLCAARLNAAIADHPPLTLWILRLSDRWTAAPVELRVRLWAVLFSLATGAAIVALARRRGADAAGCRMAAWIGTWALLPTAGGFVTTPDGPLLLAVTVALLAGGGPVAAAALALGALAKVAALPVAVALAVGWRRRWSPAGVLLALPWIWPSLRFQLHHAFAQTGPSGWSIAAAFGAITAAIGAQAGLWSPAVLWVGFRALPRLPDADRILVGLLTLLVLISATVRGVPPEPNWWAPAAVVVLIAFARAAGDLSPRARRWILASVLLPTAVAAAHTARPFLPLPERSDPTARLHGWSQGRVPDAPGTGVYGSAAERCIYRKDCAEISNYFMKMDVHE